MEVAEKRALSDSVAQWSSTLLTRSQNLEICRTGADIAIPLTWTVSLVLAAQSEDAAPILLLIATAMTVASTAFHLSGLWSITTTSRHLSARGEQLIGRIDRYQESDGGKEEARIKEIAAEIEKRANSRGPKSWPEWRPWIDDPSPIDRFKIRASRIVRRLRLR